MKSLKAYVKHISFVKEKLQMKPQNNFIFYMYVITLYIHIILHEK